MAIFRPQLSSFYGGNTTPVSRNINTRTSIRHNTQQARPRRQLASNYEYRPGMLLQEQIPQLMDDNELNEPDLQDIISESQQENAPLYDDVTTLLQQQQGMLSTLMQSQKDMIARQKEFEIKINEVEAKVKNSPQSSSSSPGTPCNKRKCHITRTLSVRASLIHQAHFIPIYIYIYIYNYCCIVNSS